LVLRPEPWRFGGDFAPIDALEAADVEADDVEFVDMEADMSFSFNKTLVVLNLSNSVRIDIILFV
jgi:hypothetical protein